MLFCPLLELDFADEGATEDEDGADDVERQEGFAEEEDGDEKGGEWVKVADERDGLSRELLQRGEVEIVGKTSVDEADDKHIDPFSLCWNNRHWITDGQQIDEHDEKGYNQLVEGAVQALHGVDEFIADDNARIEESPAGCQENAATHGGAEIDATGDAEHPNDYGTESHELVGRQAFLKKNR